MRAAVLCLMLLMAGAVHAQDAGVTEAEGAPGASAVVALIGEASTTPELSSVISELLLRQGVEAQIESRTRFDPEVWLAESSSDPRAFAFVTVEENTARLYFRGPRGERFMLRELQLRAGLDEVGRELIARVVETSTDALLHSSEGLSREEARKNLEETQPEPQPAPQVAPPPRAQPYPPKLAPAPPSEIEALIGLRVLAHFTGRDLGARFAAGLEGGVGFRGPGRIQFRVRLSAEASLPQSIESHTADAHVFAFPLRIGLDTRFTDGVYVGLSTGLDAVHLAPRRLHDDDLVLTEASTALTPVSRAELRYELSLGGPVQLALCALIDVPWQATHYEAIEGGMPKRLATTAPIQPGLAFVLGL